MNHNLNASPKITLYHTLADEDCAFIRKQIVQMDLVEKVVFRNIDRSEEAQKDLMQLQGSLKVPFMVIGEEQNVGREAILNKLRLLSNK